MQMNARLWFIFAQRAGLFSLRPCVADEEECAVSINLDTPAHTHTNNCYSISMIFTPKLFTEYIGSV